MTQQETYSATPKDTVEESPYCKICSGCGEVGCDGISSFINKHVRGKTDCLYEESYLNDIIEVYSQEDLTTEARVRAEILTKDIEELEGKECVCYCHSHDIPRKYEHTSHKFCERFTNLSDLITQKKEALKALTSKDV